jgi:hypothetical protein
MSEYKSLKVSSISRRDCFGTVQVDSSEDIVVVDDIDIFRFR